jgi:hypothetical protein
LSDTDNTVPFSPADAGGKRGKSRHGTTGRPTGHLSQRLNDDLDIPIGEEIDLGLMDMPSNLGFMSSPFGPNHSQNDQNIDNMHAMDFDLGDQGYGIPSDLRVICVVLIPGSG